MRADLVARLVVAQRVLEHRVEGGRQRRHQRGLHELLLALPAAQVIASVRAFACALLTRVGAAHSLSLFSSSSKDGTVRASWRTSAKLSSPFLEASCKGGKARGKSDRSEGANTRLGSMSARHALQHGPPGTAARRGAVRQSCGESVRLKRARARASASLDATAAIFFFLSNSAKRASESSASSLAASSSDGTPSRQRSTSAEASVPLRCDALAAAPGARSELTSNQAAPRHARPRRWRGGGGGGGGGERGSGSVQRQIPRQDIHRLPHRAGGGGKTDINLGAVWPEKRRGRQRH